ncbi:hypothetical protein JKP76_12185 [Blastococcus sp. TML/C7B]|uniref:hypothetical protein n=1 Tax=Blastococcus sp. TML/C7B TaxID=2798728 RepID=UPI00190C5E75|nr:hypothetical protein [Blastococcus sp. TML/C7B]MBN1096726.1 hypothetical protein [Blastococcus sp. TML/C7B]
MSTTHDPEHPDRPTAPRPRAPRCLRHSFWLAACDDCRRAHAHLLAGRPALR